MAEDKKLTKVHIIERCKGCTVEHIDNEVLDRLQYMLGRTDGDYFDISEYPGIIQQVIIMLLYKRMLQRGEVVIK